MIYIYLLTIPGVSRGWPFGRKVAPGNWQLAISLLPPESCPTSWLLAKIRSGDLPDPSEPQKKAGSDFWAEL